MRKFFMACLAFALFFCKPNAGNETPLYSPPQPLSTSDFLEFIEEKHQSDLLQTASLGVSVISLDSAETLVSYHSQQSLATASTLKAITTASALLLLGEDYRFATTLEHDGTLEKGVLKGNLYIRGSGDPYLGSKELSSTSWETLFAQWGNRLKTTHGITRIEGDIVADPTLFGSQLAADTWSWEDMGNYYGTGASGLNINQNEYKLYFKPAAVVGGTAQVLRSEPPMDDLTFINEMKTGAKNSGDNGYIYGVHYSNIRHLRGSIPADSAEFSIKGSMPNPALFCAKAFLSSLKTQNVPVNGIARMLDAPSDTKREVLHTHYSHTLAEMVIPTNFKSINLNTEAFLKAMGAAKEGIGTHQTGTQAVKALWEERGVNLKGFFMEDGSGLSRFNAVTPDQMTAILRKMSKTSAFPAFKKSLPIFGESGTLERIGKGSFASGKIYAKSGYIRRVRGYVGYVTTLSGKELAFAILVNNYDASYRELSNFFREAMENIVRLQ